MKTSEFKEMVRKIVAEELRAQLSTVLSEMYVKRLVAEAAPVAREGGDISGDRRPSLAAVVESSSRADVPAVAGRLKLPSWIFDGTAPVSEHAAPVGETERAFGADGVPLEMVGAGPSRWSEVARRASGRQPPVGGDLPVDETKMRELERRRRALEVKAG